MYILSIYMRIEIYNKPGLRDGRAHRLLESLRLHITKSVLDLAIADIFIVEGVSGLTEKDAKLIFSDPVSQDLSTDDDKGGISLVPGWRYMIEIATRPGVTDPVAMTAREAVSNYFDHNIPADALFQTAARYIIKSHALSDEELSRISSFLHNPLIQNAIVIGSDEWKAGKRFPGHYPSKVSPSSVTVATFDIANMDDESLLSLSKTRLLALSLEEMDAVRSHFKDRGVIEARTRAGLPEAITDVEMEMIAQTWSEHCKHKIFNATIRYTEDGKTETIDSVFKTYIKKATDIVAKDRKFLRSVFHDNSGVIQFDEETLVCFKVETHNSPSALDPYGGAITGIVGVNRDIMGTGRGAKPIWNTNYLCFGFPDTPESEIPKGILHPRQVMAGVHKGIIDGGNQSGIPVVSGGFLFDESFLGKPLVYCGTGGLLPAKVLGDNAWEKKILPKDLAIMVGGRIGKDGIHGATFSSRPLDEESPPSAVQIGDPITQKKMLDFLLEARDLGLYEGITDNGAGGLSSSLGEMATFCGGIRITLDACPLKYQGLAPWEILVSESQERMSVAVHPEHREAFLALAKKRDVEAAVVGEFTDSGFVEVMFENKPVASIDIGFLHEGLPTMILEAEWTTPQAPKVTIDPSIDCSTMLISILADPNVSSREELVRQYDHEVQGFSVVKPFVGAMEDSHSDGAVIRPRYDSAKGLTVTHGICPRSSDWDAYDMAMCSLDEAFRAHIALGGNPDEAAALDNFCWPDPIVSDSNPDGKRKLAQLVRTCRGLFDLCIAYKIPLISGKDSMKNDAVVSGRKISVRPTLLVSLIGFVTDIRLAMTTDFKKPGDLIYIAGATSGELGGSIFERLTGRSLGPCPKVVPEKALALYMAIHKAIENGCVASCHDCSDGGIAVAVAESAFGGRTGADIGLENVPGISKETEDARILFAETPSRFIISVAPNNKEVFERIMAGLDATCIGKVTGDKKLIMKRQGRTLVSISIEKVERAFKTKIG
jgi:phosphoribosylformylglycinamidine synthase subunit PurSL